jgi:hypothetical protein
MGADFTFQIIPCCKLTPERLAMAKGIIADAIVEDGDGDLRDEAHGVLDTYAEDGYEDRRDVSHLHLHGMVYYITGGMSWGDSPTEAYDDFGLIQECFTQFEQWSAEDTAARPALNPSLSRRRWQHDPHKTQTLPSS